MATSFVFLPIFFALPLPFKAALLSLSWLLFSNVNVEVKPARAQAVEEVEAVHEHAADKPK